MLNNIENFIFANYLTDKRVMANVNKDCNQ